MLSDSQIAVNLGYSSLKIKVGESISQDYERIRVIHETFPNITLRIDANQAWSPKESVTLLQKLESGGILAQFIEQPVKAHDFRGMRYIRERTLTPLLADEAIFSPKQAIELLELEGCDIVNIKLAKCGGISNALKIADIAQIYGVKCMMGCMLEGTISISASLHVVSAKSKTITMLDLDGVNLLASNPISTTNLFNESQLKLGNSYGIGASLENLGD
jgi:L-alanine-DL-glutamate epimerase-like enolase superfamily enzyme